MVERARERARIKGLPFDLDSPSLQIPPRCPALGVELEVGKGRTDRSPSLDRIVPCDGYVGGNVRVISDRANRLKGGRSFVEIQSLARRGRRSLRADYAKIAGYMERELLLRAVRSRAAQNAPDQRRWIELSALLNRLLQSPRRGPS